MFENYTKTQLPIYVYGRTYYCSPISEAVEVHDEDVAPVVEVEDEKKEPKPKKERKKRKSNKKGKK